MDITTNIANVMMTRGDTFIHRIAVKKTDGSVKDISGATAVYTVRAEDEEELVLYTKTVGAGIQLTDPIDGVLDVTLSSQETGTFIADHWYLYACKLTIAGQVCTVQSGKYRIVA
jgi:hypothetical protein